MIENPHINVKRIAWDGWEAVCVEAPLIRAIRHTAAEAVDDVIGKLLHPDERAEAKPAEDTKGEVKHEE